MMDLKEIIKWFIPCFHILLYKKVKMCNLIYISCLFLLFFIRPSYGADVYSSSDDNTKNVDNYKYLNRYNYSNYQELNKVNNEERSLEMDTSVGRTFGRPLKKMMQALIPLAFQIGAASTWMVVAAIVGFKTLLVSLVILKLLLVAGAAKFGAFIGQKTHGHGWESSPQKEIHLHIHGQNGLHEEHIRWPLYQQQAYRRYPYAYAAQVRSSTVRQHPKTNFLTPWSRDGATDTSTSDSKNINLVVNPYAAGPQTISTPYGNYVRVENHQNYNQAISSLNS